MPNLTIDTIRQILEDVYSTPNQNRLEEDWDRFEIYSGRVRDKVRKALQQSFSLPKTIQEMDSRIIPINFVQKVVNKLGSALYAESPLREPETELESDQNSIDEFVKWTGLDGVMLDANRLLKLHKHFVLEPYLSSKGKPSVRVLPAYTYTPFSFDANDPQSPTGIVKHLKIRGEKKDHRHLIWTETDQIMVDGEGNPIPDPMNPDYVNPYGVLPFVYVKEGNHLLIPISDDDLIRVQIAVCELLSDIAYASKFLSYSLIYMVNVQQGQIEINPSSVLYLNSVAGGDKPEIGTIKPEINISENLRFIETIISNLLTTKNLSVNSVSMKLDTPNPASGMAKIVDMAESTEDRQALSGMFSDAEKDLFSLIKTMFPVWMSSGNLDPKYLLSFSDQFELSVSYPLPTPQISEKDKIETEKLKLDAGLTSKRAALKEINPELNDEQITQYLDEIEAERVSVVEAMIGQAQKPDAQPA